MRVVGRNGRRRLGCFLNRCFISPINFDALNWGGKTHLPVKIKRLLKIMIKKYPQRERRRLKKRPLKMKTRKIERQPRHPIHFDNGKSLWDPSNQPTNRIDGATFKSSFLACRLIFHPSVLPSVRASSPSDGFSLSVTLGRFLFSQLVLLGFFPCSFFLSAQVLIVTQQKTSCGQQQQQQQQQQQTTTSSSSLLSQKKNASENGKEGEEEQQQQFVSLV